MYSVDIITCYSADYSHTLLQLFHHPNLLLMLCFILLTELRFNVHVCLFRGISSLSRIIITAQIHWSSIKQQSDSPNLTVLNIWWEVPWNKCLWLRVVFCPDLRESTLSPVPVHTCRWGSVFSDRLVDIWFPPLRVSGGESVEEAEYLRYGILQ